MAELVDNMDNRPLMVAIPVGVPDNIHCRNSDIAVWTLAIFLQLIIVGYMYSHSHWNFNSKSKAHFLNNVDDLDKYLLC